MREKESRTAGMLNGFFIYSNILHPNKPIDPQIKPYNQSFA